MRLIVALFGMPVPTICAPTCSPAVEDRLATVVEEEVVSPVKATIGLTGE